ncbi:HPr kinase/phosphorylase [Pelagerythrobacter marensis]|uniref:HPr kinase n=1 Tax=Pelagerythrobacter marensis TaxID=543877 RepID=A0A0G3X6W7_9SPHN|nr:HPr kinase/phosphatase C-terminal domain-containing protein [Pelagerythrobacter marensis]AKM07295.1 HPr kinase [Pelagerythrobacter marensis]
MNAPLTRQSTCVAVAGRGLMIEGPPGAGKSSLALALIDRGAVLVGDDGILLEERSGSLWAMPPIQTRGLLEARNLGLVDFPVMDAPVALRLVLDPQAPRYIERAQIADIAGAEIPSLAFDPAMQPTAFRAEIALRTYGLPLPETKAG